MTQASAFPFCLQLTLLIEAVPQSSGQPYPVADLARQMGVSPQALLNLLNDKSHHPRLDTVRRLCRVYGISLDYFECATEAACLDYLARHRVASSTQLQEISRSAETLTPRGQRNVLKILEWLRHVRR